MYPITSPPNNYSSIITEKEEKAVKEGIAEKNKFKILTKEEHKKLSLQLGHFKLLIDETNNHSELKTTYQLNYKTLQLSEIESCYQNVKNILQATQQDLKATQQDLKATKQDLKATKQTVQEQDALNTKLRLTIQQLKQELNAETNKKNEEIKRLTQTNQIKEEKINTTKRRLNLVNNDLEKALEAKQYIVDKKNQLKRRLEETTTWETEAKQEQASASEKINELTSTLASIKDVYMSVKNENITNKQLLQQEQEKANQLTTEIINLKNEVKTLENTIEESIIQQLGKETTENEQTIALQQIDNLTLTISKLTLILDSTKQAYELKEQENIQNKQLLQKEREKNSQLIIHMANQKKEFEFLMIKASQELYNSKLTLDSTKGTYPLPQQENIQTQHYEQLLKEAAQKVNHYQTVRNLETSFRQRAELKVKQLEEEIKKLKNVNTGSIEATEKSTTQLNQNRIIDLVTNN